MLDYMSNNWKDALKEIGSSIQKKELSGSRIAHVTQEEMDEAIRISQADEQMHNSDKSEPQ